jgi:hypothetical protein
MLHCRHSSFLLPTLAILALQGPAACAADEYDRPPINYNTATPANAVTRLQAVVDEGKIRLEFVEHFGYLPSLLRQFKVPVSSQGLVFSRTSLQRQRIHPRTPRAVYFNDEVYVGFCQQGEVLEISAVDPQLGTVFYTLDQREADRPRFLRQTDHCLLCHGSSANRGVPGHLLRSVYPSDAGEPILSLGSFRVDQTTPFKNRWGGWYVTGSHGRQSHLGNLVLSEPPVRPEAIDNRAGQNRTALPDRVNTEKYLSPHSDIVALMVLEHQTQAHNLLARANLETRLALYQNADLNRSLGKPADHIWDSVQVRIHTAGWELLRGLLFCEEAPLEGAITGTSTFAADFVARGPRDRKGRSLRDLDLRSRLFKYPCSYLIYSPAFDALPAEVKDYVLQRLGRVLTGEDSSAAFKHLSEEDRQAILEILRDTKPAAVAAWSR